MGVGVPALTLVDVSKETYYTVNKRPIIHRKLHIFLKIYIYIYIRKIRDLLYTGSCIYFFKKKNQRPIIHRKLHIFLQKKKSETYYTPEAAYISLRPYGGGS